VAAPLVRVGTSGWRYPRWRGDFYPAGLPQRLELSYLAERTSALEVNATFYGLQRPTTFARWRSEVPAGFVLAVKGSRYVTHVKRTHHARQGLANFLASGVLALGPALGPLLWQLPPTLAFDADDLRAFLDLLPRTTGLAAALAREHDERMAGRALTEAEEDRPLRHVVEPRHESFRDPRCSALLAEHGVGLVVADTAGHYPVLDQVTTDLVYVRLHGSAQLYSGRYSDEALQSWAQRLRGWRARGAATYAFFDNDVEGAAPYDAVRLIHVLGAEAAAPTCADS